MLAWSVTGGVVNALVVLVVALSANRLRTELAAERAAILEGHRIANTVTAGVMRQLVTLAAAMEGDTEAFRLPFDAAGSEVQDALQTYLFRPITPEQRIRIEVVKEGHRRMEVAAIRAAQLLVFEGPAAAVAARAGVMEHAQALLKALDHFLRSREGQLERFEASLAVTIRWLLAGGSVLLLLLGGGLAVLMQRMLHRRVTAPLAELAAAAGRFGEGDLATRVPVAQDREFTQLAEAFNRMAERLAAAREALTMRNQELESALEKVRRTQDELIQSEKLAAVGRMAAGLAHELNNPLTSVLGFSELFAAEARDRQVLPAELATSHLEPIVREATRARLLVRSLLQFSRRAGAETGPVRLLEALQVAVELRRHAFERAGLGLRVEPIPEVTVTAEAQQLQSVFLNILNNACDAMQPAGRGTLVVRAHRMDDDVEVVFEDDGPGLANPDRVFEPFYTTKEVGKGTGLGLALARRFVESFGGAIRASNRPEGGAVFVIRLRCTGLVSQAEEHRAPVPAPLPGATPLTAGRTALVVEDEPHLQRLSAQLLQRIGVRVLVAGDAAQARELLAEHTVDVLISDVKMPGESGVSFYRWVKARHPELARRFLFVTGDLSAAELAELEELPPHALILKPFAVTDYLARVGEVLGGGSEK
jgi:C4-dicarboxylate-specific signal transduction histidine kinase/CheY-like chemotaxis protein